MLARSPGKVFGVLASRDSKDGVVTDW